MMTAALLVAAVQAAALPPAPELERAIATADARLFHAGFEGCAPDMLAAVLAPGFAMYHDRNGKVAGSRDAFVAIIAEQCEARAPGGVHQRYRNRRDLVPGTPLVRRLCARGAPEEATPNLPDSHAGGGGGTAHPDRC